MNNSSNRFLTIIYDLLLVMRYEFKTMFRDRGVVIMLVLAPLAYPILYSSIYMNETLIEVPMAVVDQSLSVESRELLRSIDATQSIHITHRYRTLAEAKDAYNKKLVHGVVFIPADFSKKLVSAEQTSVSVYSDISSFMYYRVINQACSNAIMAMNSKIQIERLNANGIVGEQAEIISNPIPYVGVVLYNESAGFASFLLPAILIIILQQTMFLGIGMMAGTAREENKFHVLVSPTVHKGKLLRVVLGKSLCYFILFSVWSVFVLGVVTRLFNLPHIGNSWDIIQFMIPFLLATVFFSMTIGVFLPNRETGMVIFLFMSLIILFVSGVTWPMSNINWFWKTFAWIIPSTCGVLGYVKINTLGAELSIVNYEYMSLWIQSILYLVTALWAYSWQIKKSLKKQELD